MAARKKKTNSRSARETILNGQSVTLSTGKRVMIRPWGIEQRSTILPELAELIVAIRGAGDSFAELDVATFLVKYGDHIDNLVQFTLGWDDQKMGTLTLEDSLRLTNVVVSVCVIRPDGGGPLGELLRLFGTGVGILKTIMTPLIDAMAKNASTSSAKPSQSSTHGVSRLNQSEH